MGSASASLMPSPSSVGHRPSRRLSKHREACPPRARSPTLSTTLARPTRSRHIRTPTPCRAPRNRAYLAPLRRQPPTGFLLLVSPRSRVRTAARTPSRWVPLRRRRRTGGVHPTQARSTTALSPSTTTAADVRWSVSASAFRAPPRVRYVRTTCPSPECGADSLPSFQKVRPAQLVLSPSDGAIGETAAAAAAEGLDARAAAQDDRAVMSEVRARRNPRGNARLSELQTESIRAKDSKARRRLFGRSADSGSMKDTASNHSGGTPVNTPPASASPHEENMPVRRRSKGAKSVDERKQDRLSLFGSPFASSLGKHARKPAPKLSKCVQTSTGSVRVTY